MECSPPELFLSLSDGSLVEAFLESQGRRLSRDGSASSRKNSKGHSRQNSEASQDSAGRSRRCSESARDPAEGLLQLPETSSEDHGDGEELPGIRETSGVDPVLAESQSDDRFITKRQVSDSCKNSDAVKVLHRLDACDDSDVSHVKSASGQNPSMPHEDPQLNRTEEPAKTGTTGQTKKAFSKFDLSRQSVSSSKTDFSRQDSSNGKSMNTTPDAISILSGWSWHGTVRSNFSVGMRQGSFLSRKRSWRPSRFRSKSQGAKNAKGPWDRPERKEDDSSSTDPRVEMVPDSGGCTSAQESANQAAQEILISSPGSSKARQKKFHRHFKTVPPDEKVLNYYSCALVADILLQGHLYITRNYFAFYSNVFGYVTKLLIPTSSVIKVTKEKTAYIIPNAVGVTTEDDKHVFGSLLSRDSTYKFMVQVWNAALAPTPSNALPKPEGIEERLSSEPLEEPIQDEESSLSGSESNLESKLISNSVEPPPKGNTQTMAGIEVKSYHDMFSQTTPGSRAPFLTFLRSLPRPTLLLLISTGLLVLLFVSATVLLYRIARLHQAPDFSTRSMSEVHAYINSNLEHISKVRESLEKLSFLIEHGGKYHS